VLRYFEIPYVVVDLADDTGSPPPEPPIARTWRLLVCDDSPVESLAVAHFLRGNGYTVEVSMDAESTIELLQLRPFDLLILDLQMPGKDGFYVLTYLQKHRPGLPVILLSGMPIDEIQVHIRQLPSRQLPPLLLKPVDPIQLLDLIAVDLADELPAFPPYEDK
jgi:two-component system aerobic respiration control sensor histidine kinase ArcB